MELIRREGVHAKRNHRVRSTNSPSPPTNTSTTAKRRASLRPKLAWLPSRRSGWDLGKIRSERHGRTGGRGLERGRSFEWRPKHVCQLSPMDGEWRRGESRPSTGGTAGFTADFGSNRELRPGEGTSHPSSPLSLLPFLPRFRLISY